MEGFCDLLSLTNFSYVAVSFVTLGPSAGVVVTETTSSGPNCAGTMKPLRKR